MTWKTAPIAFFFLSLATAWPALALEVGPDQVRVACLDPVLVSPPGPASVLHNNRPLDSLGIPDCRLMDRILMLGAETNLASAGHSPSAPEPALATTERLAHPALQAEQWLGMQTLALLHDNAPIGQSLDGFFRLIARPTAQPVPGWKLPEAGITALQQTASGWQAIAWSTSTAAGDAWEPEFAGQAGPVALPAKCWLVSSASTTCEPDLTVHSVSATEVNDEHSTSDAYWDYYEDCDYWNVKFSSAPGLVSSRLPNHLSLPRDSKLSGLETLEAVSLNAVEYHFHWIGSQLAERHQELQAAKKDHDRQLHQVWSELEFQWVESGWQDLPGSTIVTIRWESLPW